MYLLRQGQLGDASRSNEMELDASIMLLFGSAKACISQLWSDPSTIGTATASEHDRDRINEAVVRRCDLPRSTAEQLFNQQFKGRDELIQATVDSLILGQSRKPRSPMIVDVIIETALGGQSLHVPEQIHS